MAHVTQNPQLTLTVTFTVSESEARALEAMAGYGADAFMKAFYTGCGRHYMEPHEGGMRLFLDSISGAVRPALHRLDEARKVFRGDKP